MNMQAGMAEAMEEKAESLSPEDKEKLKWYKKMKHQDFKRRKNKLKTQKLSRRKNRK